MAFEFVARNGIIALDNSTISGSLSVTNNISGSIFTGSFIGTLTGTSSFSTSGSQSISASYSFSATSASYAFSASNALTASYVEASNVVGLNLSQIATGSITASVNTNSGSFNITSGSTNLFFVSSGGDIGIGTTAPTKKLDIRTDAGVLIKGANSNSDAILSFLPTTGGRQYDFRNFGSSFGIVDSSANITRMFFNFSGNTGIGTTSPTALLHISGTSGALLQTTSGSTTGLFVSSSGFVGLGTTLPSASLDVAGGGMVVRGGGSQAPTNLNGLHFSFASNIGYIQSVQIGSSGRQLEISGFPLIFKSSSTGVETMRIATNNNVSINRQATGNATLDVSGSVLVSGSLAVSGSASITGSLGVTGNITAQTLIVQTVSSSIIYSSGSNIFGNKATDTQQFTGSVLVSGSITVSGSVTNNLTASYALNADALDGINSTQLATTGSNIFRGNQSITGSLIVSSSTFATSLIGSGSGVFTVDGTSGRLFSVDDSLSGSLFSVNTAAGLPVIEAFSDNTVRIGQFGRRALFISQSRVGFGKETQLNGNIDVSGSVVITGSLSVSGSVVNNLTASFAISASYANNFDAGYAKTFSQLTPAVTWSIIHDLNSLVPLIQVYDLNYSQILPASIVNTSRSGSSITFATSQAGYAVISTGGITVTGSNAILSQTTPATTWSFAHNLNTQFPVFTVFDSSNNVIVPLQINATNANSASIYFSSPQIGTAVAANGGVGAAASNNATASFTNSSTWTFSHNLNNRNVMIQTFDSSYNQIVPQNIQLTDINTATITFPSNTSGLAIASIGGVTGQAVSASFAFTSSFVSPLRQDVLITGSVGIGDLNPSDKLVINGRTRIDGTNKLAFGNSSGGYAQIGVSGATTGTLIFTNYTGTTTIETMRITNAGLVGIGTSSPSASLHVSGTTGGVFEVDGAAAVNALYVSASGQVGINNTTPTHMLDITTTRTGNGAGSTIRINRPDSGSFENAINWATGGTNKWFLGSDNDSTDNFYLYNWARGAFEITVLSTSGNVGIGKTAPNARLDVSGSVLISGSLTTTGNITATTLVVQTVTSSTDFVTGSTRFGSLATNTHQFTGSVLMSGSATALAVNNNALFVSSSGFIGMGVTGSTNPVRLSVSGAIESLMDAGGEGGQLTLRGNTFQYGIDNYLGNNFRIIRENDGTGASGIVLMNISASGNVGIGTATPTAKLEVNVGLNSLKISGRDTYVDSTEDATNAHIYVTQAGVGDFSQLAGNLVLQARTQGTVYRDIIFAGGLSNGDALMTILGEGNVGIGTSSPGYKLDVSGSAGDITADTSNGTVINIHGGSISTTNHGVGIGFTRDGSQLGYIKAARENTSNEASFMVFSTQTSAGTHPERMRITSGGVVQIGGTNAAPWNITSGTVSQVSMNATYPFVVAKNDDILAIFNRVGTNGVIMEFKYNSNVVGSISTNANSLPSDFNFKKDITDMSLGLNLVTKLRPVHYRHKFDNETEALSNGIIAQELEQALLDCGVEKNSLLMLQHKPVDKENESQYWVDYTKMIPVLIKSIQELTARITELENK